jgi:hypothetical protein
VRRLIISNVVVVLLGQIEVEYYFKEMHHANQAVAIGTEAITIVNKSIRELPICELIDGKEYLQDHNHNVRLHKFLANLKMLLLNLAHLLINKCT